MLEVFDMNVANSESITKHEYVVDSIELFLGECAMLMSVLMYDVAKLPKESTLMFSHNFVSFIVSFECCVA